MYGGSDEDVAKVLPAFEALKPEGEAGMVHAGKTPGAGHFAKMVHNGIEYAMMQAYAEGWELLEKVDLVDNVTEVFDSWREGTVIRSWLLDLLVAALKDDAHLDKIRGYAEDSGEGRWTVEAAIDNAVPMHVIAASLFARFSSRQDDSPAMKAVAAMRNQFGGHAVQAGAARRPPPTSTRPRRQVADGVEPLVRRPPLAARLPLLPRPGGRAGAGRHLVRRAQRAGQDQHRRGDRLPLAAALAPRRRRPAAGAARRRPGGGARRRRARRASGGARDRDQPRQVQPGPGQPRHSCRGPASCSGWCAPCVFAPDDLALVKGDPTERRRFADDLLVLHEGARYAGTRSDYDRVLKQRNSLLKTARVPRVARPRRRCPPWRCGTSGWPALGAEIMTARSRLVEELNPLLGKAYEAVARGATRDDATLTYKPSFDPGSTPVVERASASERLEPPDVDLEPPCSPRSQRRRPDELDRGVSLVGPHRDDLLCSLGELPVKGYASHGESWSFALAMRLASYELLRATGDDPVLILDDVFAELDTGPPGPARRAGRRRRAGAGDRGGARGHPRGAARATLRRGRRGGDPG